MPTLLNRSSRQSRGTGLSFSLYQTAMPFNGGWYASQGLGVIQTLAPRLGAQQASFFIPTRLVRGASTQWHNETQGITLQFSGGETGSFASIGQGSFYTSGNRVAAVGFELQPAGPGRISLLPQGLRYSAVASGATGGPAQLVPGFGLRSGEPADRGLFQSVRWESASGFVQGNLITSRGDNPLTSSTGAPSAASSSRIGAWLDGALRAGNTTHRWGLHHLASNLRWQGSALGGNAQGGYYRWSQIGLRTQLEAQLSSVQPVDLADGDATQRRVGLAVRHRLEQRLSLGGLLQASSGSARGMQISAYSELQRPWADIRLQAGYESSGARVSARRASSDQSWALPLGLRLSTSQALTSTRTGVANSGVTPAAGRGTTLDLALAGGADIGDRLSLDINAQASLPTSTQIARAYNVSASGQWRLLRGWSLGAALGLSRSSGPTGSGTVTPIPPLPGGSTSLAFPGTNSRDFWLTLRHDFQAGSAPVPIGDGGRIGAGGGSIDGVVYLDENRNGRPDALEARAANVTVTLDGRYSTRTDAQGRFEFPFVAPGLHTIAVATDTLPLPWAMPSTEAIRVEVAPRASTRVEIGTTRERSGASEP